MNFVPTNNRILVEDIIETHHGLIAMSPMTKEKPTGTGKVIAIGLGVTGVLVGDTIFRGEFIGQIVKVDGKEYRVMLAADVLGKLE